MRRDADDASVGVASSGGHKRPRKSDRRAELIRVGIGCPPPREFDQGICPVGSAHGLPQEVNRSVPTGGQRIGHECESATDGDLCSVIVTCGVGGRRRILDYGGRLGRADPALGERGLLEGRAGKAG